MNEPIHTHLTEYYLVKRPILWFAESEKVPTFKMHEYFTNKAIKSLLQYEFIVLIKK